MSQGPGAGYTLRFHRSSPSPPPAPLEPRRGRASLPETRPDQKDGDANASIKKRAEAFQGRPDTRKAVDPPSESIST